MDETKKTIKEFYDAGVETEWKRIGGRPEFLLTCRYLERYIKPGDEILDIGGGPGRYSLYLAKKGCHVTLFDLSEENVAFALKKAKEEDIPLEGITGDACRVDEHFTKQFDHILLMGPMYHLLKEEDRVKAMDAALKLLKPGGTISVSFINMMAGMVYAMKYDPKIITDKSEEEFYQTVLKNESYAGQAFTQAYFVRQDKIAPFMEQFPVKKLHLLGQESITSPCEDHIMNQPHEVVDAWLDLCEQICEREELLSWSEHLLYIGHKMLPEQNTCRINHDKVEIQVRQNLVMRTRELHEAEETFEVIDRNRDYLRTWMPWVDHTDSLEVVKDVIASWKEEQKSGTNLNLGIYRDDRYIGNIGLHNMKSSNNSAMIGYWLAEQEQGNGIMTDCVRSLMHYGFDTLNLNRIYIHCAEQNLKSRSVPERLGFVQEGIIQEGELLYGTYFNLVIYGMLKKFKSVNNIFDIK